MRDVLSPRNTTNLLKCGISSLGLLKTFVVLYVGRRLSILQIGYLFSISSQPPLNQVIMYMGQFLPGLLWGEETAASWERRMGSKQPIVLTLSQRTALLYILLRSTWQESSFRSAVEGYKATFKLVNLPSHPYSESGWAELSSEADSCLVTSLGVSEVCWREKYTLEKLQKLIGDTGRYREVIWLIDIYVWNTCLNVWQYITAEIWSIFRYSEKNLVLLFLKIIWRLRKWIHFGERW